MPIMYGVPLPGHPMLSPTEVPQSSQDLIKKKAVHQAAVESEMKHGDIPVNEPGMVSPDMPPMSKEAERLEAIKQREEAVELAELAKSPQDKEKATSLVKFWQDRIDALTREIEGQRASESQSVKVIEAPEIYSRIQASAAKRTKKPKREKKPVKKVTWLI